jgi:hypothetical protein
MTDVASAPSGLGSKARSVLAAAVVMAATVVISGPAVSQQASLAGNWSGSGTVVFPSGESEKARCRATFRTSGNGAYMNATCATPSVRVQQTAELSRVSGNRFAGDFNNAEFGVSGSISITISGNNLSASLRGGGGTAQFHLSR